MCFATQVKAQTVHPSIICKLTIKKRLYFSKVLFLNTLTLLLLLLFMLLVMLLNVQDSSFGPKNNEVTLSAPRQDSFQ